MSRTTDTLCAVCRRKQQSKAIIESKPVIDISPTPSIPPPEPNIAPPTPNFPPATPQRVFRKIEHPDERPVFVNITINNSAPEKIVETATPHKSGASESIVAAIFVLTPILICCVWPMWILNSTQQSMLSQDLKSVQDRKDYLERELQRSQFEDFKQLLASFLEQDTVNKFRDKKLMSNLESETRRIVQEKTFSSIELFHVVRDIPFDSHHNLYECFAITASKDVVFVEFIVKDNAVVRTNDVKVTPPK